MLKALCRHMQSANITKLNRVSQQVLSATCLVLQFLCLLVRFIIVVIVDFPAKWLQTSQEPQSRSLHIGYIMKGDQANNTGQIQHVLNVYTFYTSSILLSEGFTSQLQRPISQ